ncbi:MAG: hypothetical protein ACOYEP_05750 [Limnochordia bacterium]|jgi:hypothetical protein
MCAYRRKFNRPSSSDEELRYERMAQAPWGASPAPGPAAGDHARITATGSVTCKNRSDNVGEETIAVIWRVSTETGPVGRGASKHPVSSHNVKHLNENTAAEHPAPSRW